MLLTVAAGITVRDKSHCWKCGGTLTRGDRVHPVWIVAGVIKHPKHGRTVAVLHGRTDMQAPQNEYVHADCRDGRLADVATILSAERPPPVTSDMPVLEPRGDDAHCIKCQKLFQRGDRVVLTYIVQSVGRDPETKAVAAEVNGSYETKHHSCDDPKLEFGTRGDSLIAAP